MSDHYSILLLIYRFDIPLGVGERTIKEICDEHGIDVETFLFVVHFVLFGEGAGQKGLYKKLSIPLIINFLRNSHSYFLDYRLPEIRKNMLDSIEKAPEDIRFVIQKYFDNYEKEVSQHMKYEDEVVFPLSLIHIYVMPLQVEYKEKFSAVGRFPGGFTRREGRASDYEILICRLVDRALRPLFPDDYHAEVFVNITLYSGDENELPDQLAGLARCV